MDRAHSRIAAVCSQMENEQQIIENTEAARRYSGPVSAEARAALQELMVATAPGICPNCDGRCKEAGGTQLALCDIARYVAYYETQGRLNARERYHALPEAVRTDPNANLMAAHRACLSKLDFASILDKAQRYFG